MVLSPTLIARMHEHICTMPDRSFGWHKPGIDWCLSASEWIAWSWDKRQDFVGELLADGFDLEGWLRRAE
jgi:hypothetical protein